MEKKNNSMILKDVKHCDIPLFSMEGIFTKGKVVSVYDGDTCKIVIMFNDSLCKFNCRLCGIDTPELIWRGGKNKLQNTTPNTTRNDIGIVQNDKDVVRYNKKKAIQSRNRLIQLVTDQEIDLDFDKPKKYIQQIVDNNKKIIYIKIGKFDTYGRLLVMLFHNSDKLDFKCSINQLMVQENYAVYYGKPPI